MPKSVVEYWLSLWLNGGAFKGGFLRLFWVELESLACSGYIVIPYWLSLWGNGGGCLEGAFLTDETSSGISVSP